MHMCVRVLRAAMRPALVSGSYLFSTSDVSGSKQVGYNLGVSLSPYLPSCVG